MFFRADDFEWIEPPGHAGGFSRYLVNPDNVGSRYFDFRISRYPVGGRVDRHVHEIAEHVYYFLEGAGLVTVGAETRTVGANDVLFVPPGVGHAIESTGPGDLGFIVATSPPSDIAR
jgi:mannose-6-phosphate isomerase-like protein (cupin superfamily)